MSSKKKNNSKSTREQLLAYCGELHDDDCVDPKEYFKPDRKSAKADRKARQLARQAARTLDYVLADCDDELMQSLSIASVRPAPDSSRLLITIIVDTPDGEFDCATVLSRLQNQTGRLRAELGRSINRKRVPSLSYQLVAKSLLESKENSNE